MIAIAIDGPSGAGKSTLARAAAGRYGYTYLDTGALYRSIGLFALRSGIRPEDREGVPALLPKLELRLTHEADGQHVFLCGEDVSAAIRTPEVSLAASGVSAQGPVRSYLLELQREIARRQNVVMDGRDIGTVILPDAQVKIFLTASSEERARRRYEELCQRGTPAPYEEVLADVIRRDREDSTRELAPLAPAADAVLLDTTGLSFEESFQALCALIEARLNGRAAK
ncbi:MAG: (d)CMP kinase [Provencibacterium sp.]|jgi:cytidylate kinase|nr:(d)CMP kinase [Provencibacterium sp.]